MSDQQASRHEEATVSVKATAPILFDYLDRPEHLGQHMTRRSAMMLGSKMAYQMDASEGRAVGAVIRLSGNFLGLRLSVDQAVIERNPPIRKTWATQGDVNLLIIGSYRMGFEIAPKGEQSEVTVWIDYELPVKKPSLIVGRLLAPSYARWCVSKMARDAKRHFLNGTSGK